MMQSGMETGLVQAAGYGPPGGGPPGYGPPGGGGLPPMGGGPGGYGPPPGPPGYGPPPGGGFGPPPGGFGPPGGPMMMGGQPKFTPLAIISMILGIMSVPTCFCSCVFPGLNSPLAIAGLVLGIMALGKIKGNPQMFKGGGMAIAGIVTSAIGLLLVLLAALTTLDDQIRSSGGF